MKKIVMLTALAALFSLSPRVHAQAPTFARGADISWVTEMENDGKKFYNSNGVQTDLFQLMKDLGMNAIRLRVWVNPETAYGPWCDKADVVSKAKRADALGLKLMIDFHYSDFFCDPSRQTKPSAWSSYSASEVIAAVGDHTREVLQALKDEGIEPVWVQVGNETSQGMVWPDGQLNWNTSTLSTDWKEYATLHNAGYDAAKEVFPNVLVMVHLNNAYADNAWFFTTFKNAGAKFDMIGLSHYPGNSGTGNSATTDNTNAVTNIKKLYDTFQVPVMICEVGVSYNNDSYQTTAYNTLNDFYTKLKAQNICSGMFYWEPEVWGWWKPSYYTTLGWNAYNMGAFLSTGRPSKVLSVFTQAAEDYPDAEDAIADITLPNEESTQRYNLSGQPTTADKPGIYVVKGRKYLHTR